MLAEGLVEHHKKVYPRDRRGEVWKLTTPIFTWSARPKIMKSLFFSKYVMCGIKIGVFETAESIPVLSFTEKCKVLDLWGPQPILSSCDCGKILKFHVLFNVVKRSIKLGVCEAAESILVLSFTQKCKVLDLWGPRSFLSPCDCGKLFEI